MQRHASQYESEKRSKSHLHSVCMIPCTHSNPLIEIFLSNKPISDSEAHLIGITKHEGGSLKSRNTRRSLHRFPPFPRGLPHDAEEVNPSANILWAFRPALALKISDRICVHGRGRDNIPYFKSNPFNFSLHSLWLQPPEQILRASAAQISVK